MPFWVEFNYSDEKEIVRIGSVTRLSWGDKTHTFTHPRLGTNSRSKHGSHQSSSWWIDGFYDIFYRNINKELLTGAEWLKDSCISKVHKGSEPEAHWIACWQFTGWKVSFPSGSLGLRLFQAAWMISNSSEPTFKVFFAAWLV